MAFTARATRWLRQGCLTLWLNGSFVTDKPWPNDFDACWDPAGVDLDVIDPAPGAGPSTAAQTERHGGELFPNVEELVSGSLFVDFFQTDALLAQLAEYDALASGQRPVLELPSANFLKGSPAPAFRQA